MPRPTTKEGLLNAANMQFDKLISMIDSMTETEQTADFSFEVTEKDKEAHWKRDKNLRDVLIHLYEWHELLINWVEKNQSGEPVPFLPEPYNWKSYGKMNVEFWEKHQSTSCNDAKNQLIESHKKVIGIVEGFTEDELFQKAYFSWTGSNSVASYCISSTSSHYDWAMKKVKRQIKAQKDRSFA